MTTMTLNDQKLIIIALFNFRISMLIAAYVHGSDERGKIIRRTLARYLNLLSVLTFQAVSTSVKKRFPTLDHVQEAGK